VLIKRNKDKKIKRADYNQVNMRDVFTKYLTSNNFQGFAGVYNNASPILIPLTIDWKYT
jgi:hypothetical protein